MQINASRKDSSGGTWSPKTSHRTQHCCCRGPRSSVDSCCLSRSLVMRRYIRKYCILVPGQMICVDDIFPATMPSSSAPALPFRAFSATPSARQNGTTRNCCENITNTEPGGGGVGQKSGLAVLRHVQVGKLESASIQLIDRTGRKLVIKTDHRWAPLCSCVCARAGARACVLWCFLLCAWAR